LPSLDELYMFRASTLLQESTFRRTLAAITQREIKIHDRVQIACGAYRGLTGQVLEISDQEARVYLHSQDDTASIALNELRVHVTIGDEVKIVRGVHRNHTGWVVSV
ncbi:hypothetical protein BDN70DRAFT_781229, partial [Pholiota conissans]